MLGLKGIWVYDYEVFTYDWLVVFKNHASKEKVRFHNDSEGLREFFANNDVEALTGYNSKGYDKYILAATYNGYEPEKVKEVNDYIIGGGNAFDLNIKSPTNKIPQIDLMSDVRIGTSLKSIEAHLGHNIVETEVAFTINRPLTIEEIELVFGYCDNDVDEADNLIVIRGDYLETKIALGERCGITPYEAMSYTNATITAKLLGAVRRTYGDGREYEIPSVVDTSIIPQEIIDFFMTINDTSIPDDVLFKTHFDYWINGCMLRYAWGGVHGSVEGENYEEDDEWCNQNRDVASLYPNLLDLFNFISRSCANPKSYHDLKVERITAKHNGDTKTAGYLKSPLNATSGAQEAEFNPLYDPKNTRGMRITGQLLISVVIFRLLKEVPEIKFINVNTDGFMYRVKRKYLPLVDKICAEWEKETGLELETDDIKKVFIKDVNNLLFVKTNGKIKYVGGELTRGITNKGAMAINNNTTIIADAIINYLAHGKPIAETITECTDLLKFQTIAKVSSKYIGSMQMVDGQEVPIQKCNRVYATTDERYGKLYKKNRKTGNWEKVASLPEHCLIDNDNHLSIKDIDLNYYIDKATETANKFISKEGISNMADVKKKNIYQKLADLREDFYKSGLKKTGINSHAEFKYFKLDDIIPIAHELFKKHKVVFITNVTTDIAEGILRDLESDDAIVTTIPVKFIADPAKFRMNEAQASAAVVTYSRKSLYFSLFDIMEGDDSVEQATPKSEVKEAPKPVAKKPATPVQRAEIKAEMTNADGEADEMLLKSLKTACGKLIKTDKEKYNPQVQKIVVATKKFTTGSKKDVEKYIKAVNAEVKKNEVV